MQRLQSWLEGFPLGRGVRERRSRKASHSAAPTCRAPDPNSHPRRQRSFLEPKKPRKYLEPVELPQVPAIYADPWDKLPPRDLPMGGSLSQSFTSSRSSNIRTNPWIQRDKDRASMRVMRKPDYAINHDHSFSSMDRSHLRVKSFEESVCSSGYGSQDSSPESSVHSPNWQTARADKAIECRSIDVDEALGFVEESSSFSPYDNLRFNDSTEHIYHELESLTRISRVLDDRDRAYASDSECPSCSSPTSFSRRKSPIYAKPYEGPMARPYVEELYDNSYRSKSSSRAAEIRHQPEPIYASVKPTYSMGIMPRPLPPLLRPEPIRATRPAPTFCAPPPPPLNLDDELERAEMDFLAELDAQIAELQMKSEAVRNLVEEARGRRARNEQPSGDTWCRPPRWQNPRFELRL
ncbi:unnamed protein product, partial [Mesorhabditis spiculigera]